MFSGGKDSVFAFHWAVMHGFRVDCLLTFRPSRGDSMLFHVPIDAVSMQGEALGVPVLFIDVGGNEEEDLVRGLRLAASRGVEGIVTGALLSDFQRIRVSVAAGAVGLRVFNPLWRKDQGNYLRWLVGHGFQFMIISITALGIPPIFLGRIIDSRDVEELIRLSRRFGFNAAFEGGEAETLVVDAPFFSARVAVEGVPTRLGEYSWVYSLRRVWLEPKL